MRVLLVDSSHHEKLLIPSTGIVPSGTREYEDTFPCWLLFFPCTPLKNHIPVLHTGIWGKSQINSPGILKIFPCKETTLEYFRV